MQSRSDPILAMRALELFFLNGVVVTACAEAAQHAQQQENPKNYFHRNQINGFISSIYS